MQTGAAQGAVGVSIASYSENGSALMNPSLFPIPANHTSTTGRRSLLQAAAGMPYANANVQILCQSCNDTSAMLAALNSSSPSLLFSASGMQHSFIVWCISRKRNAWLFAVCISTGCQALCKLCFWRLLDDSVTQCGQAGSCR